MAGDRSTSFWNEAALRVQRQSIHATIQQQVSPPTESPAAEGKLAPVEPASARKLKSLRREAPPIPAALIPTDDLLKLRLAEELEYARRMLDAMGDSLSSDSHVLMRHGVSLQSVDIVGQMIGHIANVVRSSDPEGAVELIGMAELKGRLRRRGGI